MLIFVSVALIVVATVAYKIRWARLAELPLVADTRLDGGGAGPRRGPARRRPATPLHARDAVDTLGDRSEHATDIRQAALEVGVLTQLCPDPLSALLEQASRSEDKEWAAEFSRLYKGRTVVIDTQVTGVRDAEGGGRYELAFRVFPQGEGTRPRSQARVDLRGFKLVETIKPRAGDRLLFGARLASFKFDLENEVWLISFEADSGVTMVHHKALASLGMPAGDEESEDEPR